MYVGRRVAGEGGVDQGGGGRLSVGHWSGHAWSLRGDTSTWQQCKGAYVCVGGWGGGAFFQGCSPLQWGSLAARDTLYWSAWLQPLRRNVSTLPRASADRALPSYVKRVTHDSEDDERPR